MGEKIKNNINYIGKGIIISLVFTVFSLIILSIILTYSSIPESIETSSIIIINIISILIGSAFSTLKENSRGMIKGIAVGGIYIGILYISSSIISMKFSINISSLIMIVTSLIAGAIGGVIGINARK